MHGAVDTFKIDTDVMKYRRAISRKTTQAELLGRLADPNWAAVSVSWFPKEFRSSVMIYAVAMLPAALKRSHDTKDVVRYVFELPDYAEAEKALKKKRVEELASRRSKGSLAATKG